MTTLYEQIIIGSGFGGIGLGIRLKQAGRHHFLILEKADSVGGTWRDNTYPGAACDVESHLYSFSFAPKRDWTRRYSGHAEIKAYIESCVDRFELRPHLRFNAEVSELVFDESANHWRIHLSNGETLLSRVVITAMGQLNQPRYPDISGLDDFKGPVFHSARWDHAVELKGKRVGVIGTGASAIQFVPQLAQVARKLVVFQRSGSWVIGKKDRPFNAFEQWLFRHVPGAAKLYRTFLYVKSESRAVIFTRFHWLLKYGEWQAHRLARRDMQNLTKRQQLIPDYQIGCNRILLANDWYSSMDLPHVNLVTHPIQNVTEHGVMTADGVEHPLDALVLGTGFRASEFLTPLRVIGRSGLSLNRAWADGAAAYKGISVHGFPNLFLMYGPNTNLSHSSILLMLESQMHYVLACLNELDARNAAALDVREDCQQTYVTGLQHKLNKAVWASGCSSWYLDKNGRNVVNWYGFTYSYRWLTRRVNVNDYEWLEEGS